MKTIKLLLSIFVVMFAFNANAQNTGIAPYVNSIHDYTVTKGTTGTTTLAWTVTTGPTGGYNIVSGAAAETVEVEWLLEGEYILQLTETRDGNVCPTVRQMTVNVIANNFDVLASLKTTKEECATVVSPVVDDSSDGLNTNDDFGTTKRVFVVTASGIQTTLSWNFDYIVTNTGGALGSYDVVVDNTKASVAGSIVTVDAGTTEVLITVSYQTNANRQDPDFDIKLAISNAMDVNSTPNKSGDSEISYTINAVPATTGITTDK